MSRSSARPVARAPAGYAPYEDVMQRLKVLAARRGMSTEQTVRSLIADAVDTEVRREPFLKAAGQLRARLRKAHVRMRDSTALIRSDRNR
jgi:plasmid stability protein